ncbi:hypothetical protein ROZALSC1DRAFT_30219 [Rozella allomycis CSF55]|uniref:TFIIS N-terminal domain-containing protein n=1 Tax=Rozella allomycis (strain CSF55) TaxID=988480 RepID=A0A4P9YF01_ROZAC|nr:hypothetical protein ROZALSC1DRAFT_30219 [Rozella allomycis CSF55]
METSEVEQLKLAKQNFLECFQVDEKQISHIFENLNNLRGINFYTYTSHLNLNKEEWLVAIQKFLFGDGICNSPDEANDSRNQDKDMDYDIIIEVPSADSPTPPVPPAEVSLSDTSLLLRDIQSVISNTGGISDLKHLGKVQRMFAKYATTDGNVGLLLGLLLNTKRKTILNEVLNEKNIPFMLNSLFKKSMTDSNYGIMSKILDVWDQFPVTTEHLLQFQMGKLVSRASKVPDPEICKKAEGLKEKWKKTLNIGVKPNQSGSLGRETSSSILSPDSMSSSQSHTPTIPDKSQEIKISQKKQVKVKTLEIDSKSFTLFKNKPTSTNIHNIIPLSQKKSPVLSNGDSLCKPSSSGAKSDNVEEDEVKSPQYRKINLAEKLSAMNSSEPLKETETCSERKRKRKSVTFAENLVEYRYFEIDENERIHRQPNYDYRSLDRLEGKFVKKNSQGLEPILDWISPPKLVLNTGYINISGSKSNQKKIQEDRENKVLSVSYVKEDLIPDSPQEFEIKHGIPSRSSIMIPLKRYISNNITIARGSNLPTRSLAPNEKINSSILSSLLKNQSLISSMLNGKHST